MQTFNTLNDAIALAKFAHFKQRDKAGMPYIDHPLRVMRAVQGQGAMPYVQMAAVLHDVTEDTAFTLTGLQALGFSEAAVQLVCLMDRGRAKREFDVMFNSPYGGLDDLLMGATTADEYYYAGIKRNEDARMIKLADIADNTQAWRLNYLEPATQARLKAKYAKAIEALGVGLTPV